MNNNNNNNNSNSNRVNIKKIKELNTVILKTGKSFIVKKNVKNTDNGVYVNNNGEETFINKNKIANVHHRENYYGGKKIYSGEYRHFKLDTVNGQPVKFEAFANVKEHQSPLSAAKKLLRSYCRAKGLKESNRLKLNIKFTIRETTRGHSKVFGPYVGKYHKYTAEEMKKAKASGIVFHMKPVVKLYK